MHLAGPVHQHLILLCNDLVQGYPFLTSVTDNTFRVFMLDLGVSAHELFVMKKVIWTPKVCICSMSPGC
jgi:hypothetical protein